MPDPREKSERAARSASVVDFPGSIAGAASPDSPPGAIAPGKANRRTALNGRPARATQGHPAEPVGVAQTEPPQ
jgi:hypothetical protein